MMVTYMYGYDGYFHRPYNYVHLLFVLILHDKFNRKRVDDSDDDDD